MKHSKNCICKGTNKVPQQTSERLPGGTMINGVKDIACPYGYLRVNKAQEPTSMNSLEDFDF